MAGTARKTKPELWDKVKTKVTKGEKGGKPGQWSARKAQLATQEYKAAGGGYAGAGVRRFVCDPRRDRATRPARRPARLQGLHRKGALPAGAGIW